MTVTLQVQKRETRGKQLRTERAEGKLPGVVYGPKQEAIPLSLDKSAFEKIFRDAGESTIIVLNGLEEDVEVLVHDVVFDSTKGGAVHVDFYAIERGKELTTHVPLEYEGKAPAEEMNGVLNKVLHEIEITCRPSALPHNIPVDVSGLAEIDSQIKIKDLNIPEGVTVEHDPEDIVALIVEVEEEVEEVPEAVDMDAIEVEQKGKEEEAPEEEK